MATADIDPENIETLRAAAGRGDTNTVKTLLENSEDPSVASAYMLRAAAYFGHLDIVNLLISRGADVDASDDGETALLVAIRGAQTKVVRRLIDAGADVRARLHGGASALHEAVRTYDVIETGATLEIIDQLLENGLHIEIEDDDGRTPFHGAAFCGRVDLLDGLLARGAKLDAKDRWQETPLDHACFNGHIEVVKFLISRGAEVNTHSGGCEVLGRAGGKHQASLKKDKTLGKPGKVPSPAGSLMPSKMVPSLKILV